MQTVDFFTPIVDEPFVYGQIAAANSLSDVYAMGGRPLTALAIAGFPKKGVGNDVIASVFRGGHSKLEEAGVALLGGHTVQDPEMKFGYAVTGSVDPARIWSNAGARPGDRILLTKPIGTGVIATAAKAGRAPARMLEASVESMRTLNKAAAEALVSAGVPVHACTDVTGFGLLGHASEVAAASGVSIAFDAAKIPLFEGVLDLLPRFRNGGMASNRAHFGEGVRSDGGEPLLVDLLFDPQTSGGLLIFVGAPALPQALLALGKAGVSAVEIGAVTVPGPQRIVLR